MGNQNTLVSQLLQQLGRSIPEQFGIQTARGRGDEAQNFFQNAFQNLTLPNVGQAFFDPSNAVREFGQTRDDARTVAGGGLSSLTPGGGFDQAQKTLGGILGTGNPVGIGPSFEAGKALLEQNVNDQVAQTEESFSVRGNRFSQPLANAIGDQRRRGALDINNLLANFTRESGENAANRQAQGVTQAGNLGLARTGAASGLSSAFLNAGLQPTQAQVSAGSLPADLALRRASALDPSIATGSQLPLNVSDSLFQFEQFGAQAPQDRARTVSEVGTQIPQAAGDFLNQLMQQSLLAGGQQQGQAQTDIQNSFSEFQNRQPFSNPAFNSALAFSTGFPPVSGAQPGLAGSAIGAGGSIGAAILPALMAKSSLKYKENVVPFEDSKSLLALVEHATLVEFDYKDIDGKRHVGIILENEDPRFATEKGDRIDVDIVGILLGSIQELSKRVKELENK